MTTDTMSRGVFKSKAYSEALLVQLKELYDRNDLCDFSLLTNTEEFHVHRVILCAGSSFFKAILCNDSAHESFFHCQTTDGDSLHTLIHFLYTGDLVLSQTNVSKISALAKQFEFHDVTELCQQFTAELAASSALRFTPAGDVQKSASNSPTVANPMKDHHVGIVRAVDNQGDDEQDIVIKREEEDDTTYDELIKIEPRSPDVGSCTKTHITPSSVSSVHMKTDDNKPQSQRLGQRSSPKCGQVRKKCIRTRLNVCKLCGANFSRLSRLHLHSRSHFRVRYREISYRHSLKWAKQNLSHKYVSNKALSTPVSGDSRYFTCQICDKSWIIFNKLAAHRIKHHPMTRSVYKRLKCSPQKPFNSAKQLYFHSVSSYGDTPCTAEGGGKKLYKCRNCSRRFLYERTLLQHKCTTRPESCGNDGKRQPTWKCNERDCQFSGRTNDSYITHMVDRHPTVNFKAALRRCSYTNAFKLEVIHYAQTHGNSATGRHFQISGTNVRSWSKSKAFIEKRPKSARAARSAAPHHPELETLLISWIHELRASNEVVDLTANKIRAKAKLLAKQCNVDATFKASIGWCSNFKKRNGDLFSTASKL